MRISDGSSDVCSSDLQMRNSPNRAAPSDMVSSLNHHLRHIFRKKAAMPPAFRCNLNRKFVSSASTITPALAIFAEIASQDIDPSFCASLRAKWMLTDLATPRAIDRQSVVSGKSVSVGVNLGGRRIITKK